MLPLKAILISGAVIGTLFSGLLKYNHQENTTPHNVISYHDIEFLSWKLWDDYMSERNEKIEKAIQEENKWKLLLVNWENPLPKEFEVHRVKTDNNQYVDERIADYLNEMLADAKEEGIHIDIISGYRSYDRQVKLYENKVKRLKRQGMDEELARIEAAKVVAYPGTSEHMTGLAVDLVSSEFRVLEKEQEETQAYKWLHEHCMEYGFIVRYPNGKTELTGIIYEPWHFRYVGKEHAKIIMENGWCLEEYLEYLSTNDENS